jgi:hypothetical protein
VRGEPQRVDVFFERDRRGDRVVEEEIIPLWIISAGRPRSVIERFKLRRRRGWPRGVYGAGAGYGWNVVVVSELPSTRETLLLRLLGTGATRERAMDFRWASCPSEGSKGRSPWR